MAYIVVTTDEGTVVFKKHHTQYPHELGGVCRLTNELTNAVLEARTYFEKLRKKQRELLGT